jgi:hypothetical protein
VRVAQPRQGLLFQREARQHGLGIHAALEQLDRRLAAVGAVVALGQPDVAHAAAAQQRHDAPGPQALAGTAGRGGHGALLQERVVVGVVQER